MSDTNPFGGLGGEGGFDLNAMLEQAQQMQAQLVAAQEELAATSVEGSAGGVTVTLTGTGELTAVTVSPGSFDGSDADSLDRPRRPGGGGVPRRARRRSTTSPRRLSARWPAVASAGPMTAAHPSCLAVSVYEGVLQDLIDELARLPGVGPKGAQRIAFHLLAADPADVRRLADVLVEMKAKATFCKVCGNVSQAELCRICSDERRDPTLICVVEEPKDVVAIERTREFRGRYHVLGGAISPLEGIGPEQLRIRELMSRLADGNVTEVILATDPNIEGDATAAYLSRFLTDMDLRVDASGEWTAGRR